MNPQLSFAHSNNLNRVFKFCLNRVIFNMPLLTENAMPKAHMSLVQVMRLICHVYSLSFVDKGLYVIQNIYELSYPKTCCEIKSDVTQNLIGRLSFIKVSKQSAFSPMIILNSNLFRI